MALTLEDIARLSGVSRSTVSRVVNGDENVSPATRERVLNVIQQHNYQPNPAARRLAAGRTHTLGLVIADRTGTAFSNPYFSPIIQGVSNACNQQEYSLMLWLSNLQHEQRILRQLTSTNLVDGVIVSFTLANDPMIETLARGILPFVVIGHHPTPAIHSVDLDHRKAAGLATRHLLQHGYRRIATISGPLSQIAGQERLQGFRQTLSEAGLLDERLIAAGNFDETSGYTAMQKLLPQNPQGVFVANDVMAAGAYRAIKEAGLKIPDDIAVVGFDDIPLAAQLQPPLTTIRQPMQTLGTLAVQRLLDILHQPDTPPQQLLLPPELIIRQSCPTH
ncbi:MAG: LacI family DNA-binding transcriptional regulator [Anaerolineales bacterium]